MSLFRQFPVSAPVRTRGFTLVELLVVVAIVGILATIAVPSFNSQLRKGRRSDAIEGLSRLMQAQERWRANRASYADTTLLTTNWPSGLGLNSTTTSGGYYTLSIATDPAPNETSYTAHATAVSGKSQAGDTGCATMTVQVSNASISYSTTADCWSK